MRDDPNVEGMDNRVGKHPDQIPFTDRDLNHPDAKPGPHGGELRQVAIRPDGKAGFIPLRGGQRVHQRQIRSGLVRADQGVSREIRQRFGAAACLYISP